MTAPTDEELKRRHERWLADPGTSNGQREDSQTILRLLDQLDAAKAALEEIADREGEDYEPDGFEELVATALSAPASPLDALKAKHFREAADFVEGYADNDPEYREFYADILRARAARLSPQEKGE